MSYTKISDYGLIGDTSSAALVSKQGSIDWACLPRFDSPSVFAALLDHRKGGRFSVAPDQPFHSEQSYLGDTAVLVTHFTTDTGELRLVDFMPPYSQWRESSDVHEICRLAVCTKGRLSLSCHFQPALDYARGAVSYEKTDGGVVARSGQHSVTLYGNLDLYESGKGAMVGTTDMEEGDRIVLLLKSGVDANGHIASVRSLYNPDEIDRKLEETCDFWNSTIGQMNHDSPWRKEVIRSAITLQLLIYAPTGAVVAAPTTSLPEEIGGERNWDYRFCWLRDSAFAMDVLSQMGATKQVPRYLAWLSDFFRRNPTKTPIMASIDFETPLAETTLDHLEGYKGSSPVRIGNGAASQMQLDVLGELMLFSTTLKRHQLSTTGESWPMFARLVRQAFRNYRNRDNGIWEVRGPSRHFTFSKLMCWVALDRGIEIARDLGEYGEAKDWQTVRDELRKEILAQGWNTNKQTFVQYYGGQSTDASLLLMPLVKFLPGDDTRVERTVQRITQELGDNGLLYRYRTEEGVDGLPGSEGAFTMLSFWLVDCLTYAGHYEQATELLNSLLGRANHLGLYSEMIDPTTGEFLGNFPQAFTHIALMHSARHLASAYHGKTLQYPQTSRRSRYWPMPSYPNGMAIPSVGPGMPDGIAPVPEIEVVGSR